MHGNSCDKPSGTVRIDQAYIDRNVPIVKEQLQKAGVRLAAPSASLISAGMSRHTIDPAN